MEMVRVYIGFLILEFTEHNEGITDRIWQRLAESTNSNLRCSSTRFSPYTTYRYLLNILLASRTLLSHPTYDFMISFSSCELSSSDAPRHRRFPPSRAPSFEIPGSPALQD